MKPVVSALNAWSCFIISLFAVIILSVLGSLFKRNHHSMTGSTKDPENGPAVAASIFTAVVVYAVRILALPPSLVRQTHDGCSGPIESRISSLPKCDTPRIC
ncbi:hypothetical protein AJ79_02153 [Helicocarpus griseus UAMH5409]|uniref:Uncharacterized protein n=1 Tax=Helicocarpus griseus UAMH5409 TaxID=1447875 RepID=A0A2B7Y408_9EURO|nr:hypothetical protein AJ79_02153 [Helicocarpus griseus UAMH5409]